MLFGISEMREFAKWHKDQRVQSMMRKIEGLMNKAARQHETILKKECNMIKIFEDDLFFVRDDVQSGIELGDGLMRYSVFSKVPYRRLKVYAGPKEWAIEQFWLEYEKFIEELENDQ